MPTECKGLIMNLKRILLTAVLLLSTTGYAAASDRDDAIYAEVKRFWTTQLEGGESAVIEAVKACYSVQMQNPLTSLQDAERCIIWDTALAASSRSMSQELAKQFEKNPEEIQTPFARRESMNLRAMELLSEYGMKVDAATIRLKDIDKRVAEIFGQAFGDASKELLAPDTRSKDEEVLPVKRPWEQNWNAKDQYQGWLEENFGSQALSNVKAKDSAKKEGDASLVDKIAKEIEESDKREAESEFIAGVRAMSVDGRGASHSNPMAARHFRNAAEKGHATAQTMLGLAYILGEGVEFNSAEAAKWIGLSAKQGDARGQFSMGLMYEEGRGVLQDYKEAVRWYLLAAEQGEKDAQFYLGRSYVKGLGVLQDFKEAGKWFLHAAGKDHAEAQYALGLLFQGGHGVPESRPAAYALFNISSVGNPSSSNPAIEKRAALIRLLSAQEIASAQALANEMAKPSNLIKALNQYLDRQLIKKKKSM